MGIKQGFGTYKFHDGKIYEGEWKNGKQHGKGKIIFTNGRIE